MVPKVLGMLGEFSYQTHKEAWDGPEAGEILIYSIHYMETIPLNSQ